MRKKEKNKIERVRQKRTLKSKDGITLIALVITIIILLILATVTLNVVLGEGGLIDRAQQAKDLTEQAALEEQQGLNSLMSEFTNIMAEDQTPPEPPKVPETVEEAKDSGTPFENTTIIPDDLDNPVTIPGGFHIDEDSGTKVEEGIVIEDDDGNQFVWIPVGEYNVSTTINSSGKLTNELSRREFTESDSTLVNGDGVIEGLLTEENITEENGGYYNEYYYGEGDSRSVAKEQIEGFKTSANSNKGFYIGRYEAGTETERTASTDQLTTPLVQGNKYPYAYVTRDEAKQQAEAMYNGNTYVTSELISSYAWDTALNFICQTNEEGYLLATTTDSAYGNIGTDNRTQTGSYTVNGEIPDKYSNVFDILGNCYEWTTEYSSFMWYYTKNDCVFRGGRFYSSETPTASRSSTDKGASYDSSSFRIQLYINPES